MTTPSHIGRSCAAPDCDSIILFSASQFCTQHQFLTSQGPPLPNDGPSNTDPSKSFRPSDRGFVARRGRGRFMFGHSRQSLTRSHSAPRPDPPSRKSSTTGSSLRATQSPAPKPNTGASLTQFPAPNGIGTVAPKSHVPQHQREFGNANGHLKPVHQSSHTHTLKDLAKTGKGHAATQAKSLSVSDVQRLPEDSSNGKDKTLSLSTNLVLDNKKSAPVANMGPDIPSTKDSKTEAQEIERPSQTVAHKNLTSTKEKSGKATVPQVIKKPKLSPGPSKQQAASSKSPVNPVQQLDSEAVIRPKSNFSPEKTGQLEPTTQAERTKALKTSSSRLQLNHAKHLTHQASNASPDKKRPLLAVLPDVPAEVDDEANMADVSDSSDEQVSSPTKTVLLPFRAKAEAQRKEILARFDSAAFDSFIYQQSDLRPPAGVNVSRVVRNVPALNQGPQLFLPVNPAIHKMHKRSQAWYKQKCEEIRRRPGRKAWFGKVHARKRWIYAMEAKLEREREQARLAGTVPPYKPPEPRGVKRILDFGDVPEEELPDYVRSNPAWLKACAWHRESHNQAILHQRRVDRSTEEAERFFHENFSGR
ncbi:hypothetical protein F66182_8849 [Fusarium sp. NRRL 66182]|nr:hypothetical protein F66182_8849 [Fusarium sp. NRRL 66182]